MSSLKHHESTVGSDCGGGGEDSLVPNGANVFGRFTHPPPSHHGIVWVLPVISLVSILSNHVFPA
jgi:hypothetical protein